MSARASFHEAHRDKTETFRANLHRLGVLKIPDMKKPRSDAAVIGVNFVGLSNEPLGEYECVNPSERLAIPALHLGGRCLKTERGSIRDTPALQPLLKLRG